MEILKLVVESIRLLADVFTIAASGIAIYVFLANRTEIAAAVRLLVNYSYQTTLGELKQKLERLNEYNAREIEDLPEIRNILHEIAGQIKGNSKLKSAVPDLPQRIEEAANNKKLSEPLKRSLVSEIREVLKNLTVNSMTGE